MKPEDCSSFNECSAPFCPLDPDIEKRVWFSTEEVCRSRKYGQHRAIRKQRSIQKRQTKCWLNRAIRWRELCERSKPKKFSNEQKIQFGNRLREWRAKGKIVSGNNEGQCSEFLDGQDRGGRGRLGQMSQLG
jgi:hypothetical protein